MSGEPDDLTAFTRALSDVAPHPGRLDRDALLFAAGRAAGRRGVFWPVTTAALAVLSTALALTLLTRSPAVVEVERIVYVPTPVPRDAPEADPVPAVDDLPAPTQPPSSPALVEGLRLRQSVLRDGVDTLPQTSWAFSSPAPTGAPDLSSLRLNASRPDGGKVQ